MAKNKFLQHFLVFPLAIAFMSSAWADVQMIKIKWGDKVTTSKDVSDLADMRKLYQSKKYAECIKKHARLEKKYLELKPWLALQKLNCAAEAYRQDNVKFYTEMYNTVQALWKNSEWILWGPHSRRLRIDLIEASLGLLELESKKNRSQAWSDISRLLDVRDWLTTKQRARLYRFAGELSFAAQNLEAARDYFEKSNNDEPNKQVLARLESILNTLDPNREKVEKVSATSADQASAEESEIYKRMLQMQQAGDFVAAIEDGVKLLKQYPGSKNSSEAAKRILNIYLGVAAKNEEKYVAVKERILNEMKKVDGQRLFDWSQTLSAREYFSDSLELAKTSVANIGGQPFSTQVLLLAGLTAYHSANFKFARSQFEKLILEHAGTKAAAEARYRLGLIDFREEKYAESASHFERYLQLEYNSDFEQSSMYWWWRSLQKTENNNNVELNQARAVAERLIAKYPVSYYGLRARAELSNNKINFVENLPQSPVWSLTLTQGEATAWERFQLLQKAGWIEEAQAELGFLSEPSLAEGKLIYASIWSSAQNYHTSSEVLSRAFSLNPNLIARDSLRVAYPLSYLNEIKTEAQRYKIPAQLVSALIKQESSFRVDVASPAGAMGLMQLMPVTAREVASDMRIKIGDLTQDLSTPGINIRIGTQYLHRRLKAFEGHVPLALASYNAGIGNIRSWLRSRIDLKDLQKVQSSDPRDEIWFDELPWPETCGYIKSILRNYLIYKLLDQGEYEFSNPTWKFDT